MAMQSRRKLEEQVEQNHTNEKKFFEDIQKQRQKNYSLLKKLQDLERDLAEQKIAMATQTELNHSLEEQKRALATQVEQNEIKFSQDIKEQKQNNELLLRELKDLKGQLEEATTTQTKLNCSHQAKISQLQENMAKQVDELEKEKKESIRNLKVHYMTRFRKTRIWLAVKIILRETFLTEWYSKVCSLSKGS